VEKKMDVHGFAMVDGVLVREYPCLDASYQQLLLRDLFCHFDWREIEQQNIEDGTVGCVLLELGVVLVEDVRAQEDGSKAMIAAEMNIIGKSGSF
jgi:hypothetical protein